MEITEESIFNLITDSAKKKFDYHSLEEGLIGPVIADNVVFQIIIGFAQGKDSNILAHEIFNQLLMVGIHTDLNNFIEFITDKKVLFQKEILAFQIAANMLQGNGSPVAIYGVIAPARDQSLAKR